MTALRSITLAGFKGLDRTYRLGGPTLLVGPNGSGKSAAMEGIVYAFTGKSPAGKLSGDVSIGTARELVAQYFPPTGGFVQVEDIEGRWIRRGISRDRKETLETSDTPAEAKAPDLTAWQARPEVLDLREFLALSPERRREFFLRLCGGGAAPEDLLGLIEVEYVRALAGPGARPEVLVRIADLGPELAALAGAWTARLGLREVLDSHLRVKDQVLSETLLKVADVAHKAILKARSDGKEAAAAKEELETAAETARPLAAQVDERAMARDAAEQAMQAGKTAKAVLFEARRAADWADEQLADAKRRQADFQAALERHPPPGPRPVPAETSPDADRLSSEDLRMVDAIGTLKQRLAEIQRSRAELDTMAFRLDGLRRDLASHQALPMAALIRLAGRIVNAAHLNVPDELRQDVAELYQVVDALSTSWRARKAELEAHIAELAAPPAAAADALAEEARYCSDETARIRMLRTKLLEELEVLSAQEAKQRAAYQQDLDAWQARDRNHRSADEGYRGWSTEVGKQEEHAAKNRKRLQEVETAGAPASLEALEVATYQAEEALTQAREAAGAVAAFDACLARASAAKVEEEAWKLAERAIRVIREKLVGAATMPLLEELAAFLRSAGRHERPYLETENDRGKPIFELGWERNGARTALPALSTGEAVLFCAGLSLAIARRSPGRKLLLIEADPLDPTNLSALFEALGAHAAGLDALVVATAAEDGGVYAKRAGGWNVTRLGGVKVPAEVTSG